MTSASDNPSNPSPSPKVAAPSPPPGSPVIGMELNPFSESRASNVTQELLGQSITTTRSFGGIPPEDRSMALPPKLQDRYVFVAPLGQGGFGRVFKAWDETLRRDVAIKFARSERFQGTEGQQRFLEEARAAAKLKHPNLVTVFDSGLTPEGIPFVVFEYVPGESLAARLKRQPSLTIEQCQSLIIAVTEAMQAAHRAGLFHRDLKPANILLDAAGQPHVTDFGLAVDESSQRDRAGEVAGSPQYMSPEQVRGEAQYLDGRTDIWSLGVILYELLAQKRPFSGRDRDEIKGEILNRDPRPIRQLNDQIPAHLDRICQKCLKKVVTDRYASAADLLTDLNVYRKPWYRKPLAFTLIAISVMSILGTATYALGRLQTEAPPPPERIGSYSLRFNDTELITPIKGQWTPVLLRPPHVVEWPFGAKNSRWEWDPAVPTVWIICETRCLLKYGQIDSGNYRIQADIYQPGWSGGAGFFWGRRDAMFEDKPVTRYQILQLKPSMDGINNYLNIMRGFIEVDKTVNQRLVRRWDNDAERIMFNGFYDQHMKLTIQDGKIHDVSFGGKRCLSKLSPDPKFFTKESYYGEWGVFAELSCGMFRNVEIFVDPTSTK